MFFNCYKQLGAIGKNTDETLNEFEHKKLNTMNMINLNRIFIIFGFVVFTTFTTYATIPGPDYIYKCPKCSKLLKKGSITSGNTFGSTLYSDGKMIAPMLPEFPNLTKCEKCDTILWLSEMKEIGTCNEWDKKCKRTWKNAERVKFLDVNDLFRFLELDIVKNDNEKEKIVRLQIWWTFNDRIREGKEIFLKDFDEDLWKQNCQRLIELFEEKDINQKIMTAELYRNLGEFDTCLKLLDTVEDEYNWIVEKFQIECVKRNKILIKLR